MIYMEQKSSPSSAKESKLVFIFSRKVEYTQKDCKIDTTKLFILVLIARWKRFNKKKIHLNIYSIIPNTRFITIKIS